MSPILLAFLGLLFSVVAIPTFNDLGTRASIGSLIPDASHIQVFLRRPNSLLSHTLTLHDPAFPGNLTAIPNAHPLSFYVFKDRLWAYRNESTIWPVNLVNATEIPGFPLQLVVGAKQFGVTQGTWSWWGTMLHYDHGAEWQRFFTCPITSVGIGIFLYTSPTALSHCDFVTFHSFQRDS